MNFLLSFIRNQVEYIQQFCDKANLGRLDDLDEEGVNTLIGTIGKSMELFKSLSSDRQIDIGIELAVIEAVLAWRKNKQVYSFEPEFAEILCESPLDITIERGILDTLPYPIFALEIGDHYSLVHHYVTDFEGEHIDHLHVVALDPDNFMETWTYIYHLGKGKTIQDALDRKVNNYSGEDGINRQIEAIQATLYLAAENAKIVENLKQKEIYKERGPHSRIRDKFSEIRKWDCGIRENTFKLTKVVSNNSNNDSKRDYSPKRPHWRRAHWQTYWTGKGRTIPKLLWIQPMRIHPELEIPVTKTTLEGK